MLFSKSSLLSLAAAGFLALPGQAAVIYSFANWNSATASTATTPGVALGSITKSDSTVNVTYTGDLFFAQTNETGTNYFNNQETVYTNSTVANVPGTPDLLLLDESETMPFLQTITFSSPVVDPILDLVSLGGNGIDVTYTFDTPFTLLSQGPAYFGGCNTCLTQSGSALTGDEGSGVIEFAGSISSLSFTTSGSEVWNGFNVGIAQTAISSAPEPATYATLLTAMLFGVSRAWPPPEKLSKIPSIAGLVR